MALHRVRALRRPDGNVANRARAEVARRGPSPNQEASPGMVSARRSESGRQKRACRALRKAMAAFGKARHRDNNPAVGDPAVREALRRGDAGRTDLKLFAAIGSMPVWRSEGAARGRILNILNIGAKGARPNSAPTAISRAAGWRHQDHVGRGRAAQTFWSTPMLVGLDSRRDRTCRPRR